MLPVASRFDVYLLVLGSEAARRETVARLGGVVTLDGERRAQLLRGERTMICAGLSDGEAQRIATSVRALGLRVDLEAHRGGADMVDLGDVSRDEPAPAYVPVENPFFDVNAGLVGLDGTEIEPPRPVAAPSSSPSFDGLLGLSLRDADEALAGGDAPEELDLTEAQPVAAAPALAPPPPPAIPLAPSRAAPPAAPVDTRFRPSSDHSNEILLDQPAPTGKAPPPTISAAGDTVSAPQCPRHGVARVGGRCPVCVEEETRLRGRLFAGKLRNQPILRIGIGLGAGLFVGWLATTPMARRAERQVDFIREEARRERARPLDEAQAHAAQLETQADDEAQGAFMRMLGIWGAITATVTAAWFRLT